MTVSSISAYQWLSQPISGCLIYLSLSGAISAYQWLSDLSQPISGCLITSAYQWLSQPISGYLIYRSLSAAISSIAAYQQLSQPISGCLVYLSLPVAALVSQSTVQRHYVSNVVVVVQCLTNWLYTPLPFIYCYFLSTAVPFTSCISRAIVVFQLLLFE